MANWTRGKQLGKGFHAEVHQAIPIGSGPIMAVKSVPAMKAASLISERYFLEKLDSVPGVLPCLGGGFSDSDPRTYDLLLEYTPFGSLHDFIHKRRHGLCWGRKFGIHRDTVSLFTRKILNTLDSIHRLGVVHCNVNPGNILIFADPELKLKLADFRSAVETKDVVTGEYNCRGTLHYMSPELVKNGEVTPAVDVWALGCTVLEMFIGYPPWKDWGPEMDEELKETLIAKGMSPKIPSWVCEEGKDFLRWCFEKDPNQRPSAETLLQHSFVGGPGLPKWKKRIAFSGFLFLPHLMFQRNRAVVV